MGYKTEIKPHTVFVEEKNDEYNQWRERKYPDGAEECPLLIAQQWEKGGQGLSQSYGKWFSLCSITNVWFDETASLLPLWASYYETTFLTPSICGVLNLNTITEKTDSGLSMWKKITIFDIHKTLIKGDARARCGGTNLSPQHSGDRGRAQTARSSRPAWFI